jgi:hypothetical protein
MAGVMLDKSFKSSVASHGTIEIRVVVLRPRPKGAQASEESTGPVPDDEGEPLVESGSSPLSAYLERKAHGRQCVVFLVNGQRHDAWDNSFISRDLGFKYLRTRTMIVLELDGLMPEAISEIVQGSRQGLYAGLVLGAISDRLVATLKKDPDLLRLQVEAEQELAELQAGDEVVRKKLDELIDAHHAAASHVQVGTAESGDTRTDETVGLGKLKRQDVITEALPSVGEPGALPVLVANPQGKTLRLRPNAEVVLHVGSLPQTAWEPMTDIDVRISPQINELRIKTAQTSSGADVALTFYEPEDFSDEEYPLETTLRVFARFKGHAELRVLERDLIINRRRKRPPVERPRLSLAPSVLRIVSRQPVKLVPGGPSAHVRVSWDGEDSLAVGPSPEWTFEAYCPSLATFPPINFTAPRDGRFELLIDTPRGLLPEQRLEFELRAMGPDGGQLSTRFTGEIAPSPPTPLAPEPRRILQTAPEAAGQRRPPYDLKYVSEDHWDTPTCWAESPWTGEDVGAFSEPTESTPLTLVINEDAHGLKEFREGLVKRGLDESTVRERVTRYTAHVAFHLYQMFRFKRAQFDAQVEDDTVRVPNEDEMRLEIGRVATTLLKLMETPR